MKKLITALMALTMITQSSLLVFAENEETPADTPQETEEIAVSEDNEMLDLLKQVINEIRKDNELAECVFDEKLGQLMEEKKEDLEALKEEYTLIKEETEEYTSEKLKELFKESEWILSEDLKQDIGLYVDVNEEGTYVIYVLLPKQTETEKEERKEDAEATVLETELLTAEEGLEKTVEEPKETEELKEAEEKPAEEEVTVETEEAEEEKEVPQVMMRTAFFTQSVTGFSSTPQGMIYVDPLTSTVVRGQKKIDGYWYYFDETTGVMITGWKDIPSQNKTVYYDANGHMLYGMQVIDGQTYFLDRANSGGVIKGQIKKDGYWYYFDDETGAMITGWKEITYQNKMVYYDRYGHMLYGMQVIDGRTYFLDRASSGGVIKGQKNMNGYWYYFDDITGAMITGWKDIPSQHKTVYYDENGHMLYGMQEIDGKIYFLDRANSGGVIKGQLKKDGYWYYFDDETGAMITGWKEIPSQHKTVYYDENGHMLYDMQVIDGKTYFLDRANSGGVIKGQIKKDGYWYYFDDETGAMITGWKDIPSQKKRVYYNEYGHMLYGEQKIDGYTYYLLPGTGAMQTGWATIAVARKTVYLDENGHMLYGDHYVDGVLYHFDSKTGAVMDSFQEIKDANGNWIKVYYDNGQIMKHGFKLNQTYYQVDESTGAIIHEQPLFSDAIYMEGIDISEHNGNIDLTQYQNGFVIIRIGYWTVPDKKAIRNMDLCDKYNIPYGVYLYDYTTDPEGAEEEADFTLRMIAGRNVRCGVWFDMEDDGWRARNGVAPDHPNISKLCQAYCRKIEAAGYHVGIYASYSWFENYITGCDRWDKWVAHWGSNNGNWNINLSDYAPMHQFTSQPLDRNVMYVDPEYFSK